MPRLGAPQETVHINLASRQFSLSLLCVCGCVCCVVNLSSTRISIKYYSIPPHPRGHLLSTDPLPTLLSYVSWNTVSHYCSNTRAFSLPAEFFVNFFVYKFFPRKCWSCFYPLDTLKNIIKTSFIWKILTCIYRKPLERIAHSCSMQTDSKEMVYILVFWSPKEINSFLLEGLFYFRDIILVPVSKTYLLDWGLMFLTKNQLQFLNNN